MKKTAFVCAALAGAMSFASLSFAQGERGNDRCDRHDQRYERRDDRGGRAERAPREEFQYGARGPEWRRGGRMPSEYRHRQYVVSDWRAHQLAPPPRGYQWVQVGGDYVLAAIATGIIAQLTLNSR
jgi:Ni/Co efflux regulator RcnB